MSKRPVALITGASRGIGAATAFEFAAVGYDLALIDRDADGLVSVASAVQSSGSEALTFPLDLAELDAAREAVEQAAAHFGRIDALVNNAAWRQVQSMRETDLGTWEKTLRICLTAPAFLAKWTAEIMHRRRSGVIINVSSIRSAMPDGTCAAYVAAKGALESLTYELAALYGQVGIRVLAIQPGAIDTEMSGDLAAADVVSEIHDDCIDRTPLGRFGRTEEIAQLIVMLASDAAGFVTGTTITADGGLSRNGYGQRIKHLMQPEQFP